MLIPIGHEDSGVRRLPWVTFTIMILCVVVFAMALPAVNAARAEAIRLTGEVRTYYSSHPYLHVDTEGEALIFLGVPQDQIPAFKEILKERGPKPPLDKDVLQREQLGLDDLMARAWVAGRSGPEWTFGFIPAHMTLLGLIGHMFMHGGWLHLLGNLFILYLTGPFLEDAWGRPMYAVFYLVAGCFAALMFAARYPHLDGPLIGASGAIAGVMGAFLIRFWSRKIRFFYWFAIVFHGTFLAPAWLMLGLWFLRELLFAQAMDTLLPGAGGGGVAYWAHVWGFAFGAIVAVGVRRFKVEEKYIEKALDAKVTLVSNPVIDRAMEAFRGGQVDHAMGLLGREVRTNPANLDAALALWNMACDSGRAAEAAPVAARVVRSAAREGNDDLALAVWTELHQRVPDSPLDAGTLVAVAERLVAGNRVAEAIEVLDGLAAGELAQMPPGPLVKAARLAAGIGMPCARRLVEATGVRSDIPKETVAELERELDRGLEVSEPAMESAEPGAPAEMEPIAVQHQVRHTASVVTAIPARLEATGLVIDVGGGERTLPNRQIQALAAVGIRADSGKPFILIDLLLDPPWSDRQALRMIRLRSSEFDPRPLMGVAGNPMEALRKLLDELLQATGAAPLPDPDAARGRPFAIFPSLEAYESEVLGC